jgi:hypothetical protein
MNPGTLLRCPTCGKDPFRCFCSKTLISLAPALPAGDGSSPSAGSAADVESAVCEDIKARQRRGIAKYGTTVANNPLTQTEWLQHAYEEALDLAIYLKKIISGTQHPNVGSELRQVESE